VLKFVTLNYMNNMINTLIPPEIKGDSFYQALEMLSSNQGIKTILEIGSSSGEGSTEALVTGVRARIDRDSVRLFCMELSKPRFEKLEAHYASDLFVKCYNLSSVALDEFPSVEEVSNFHAMTRSQLPKYAPLDVLLQWLKDDIDYVKGAGSHFNGVRHIKKVNNIIDFDLVLIDGSEFTGEREYYSIAGAKVIALDDVNAHKCFNVYQILKNHVAYRLIFEDLTLRQGFAIFQRRY